VNKHNHNAHAEENQEAMWKLEQIVAKLPADLEQSAKDYGVIIRKRQIKSAFDLFRMLLIYVVICVSQRTLAAYAQVLNVASITDQAWQKKMVKCEDWLTHVLSQTLPATNKIASEATIFANRQINLVDCTHVMQCGKNGMKLRIHTCYSLSHSCMNEIQITDHHTAESISQFTICPGSIYLADAGYGTGKNYEYVTSQEGDAIFRVTPNQLLLANDTRGAEKIDMVKQLETGEDVVDFTCYVHSEKRKYVPVRIIASRLPKDKIEAAVNRKKRKAQKKQNQVQEKTLQYAQWVIVMTSMDERYRAEEILRLYQSRWQVELLYKRIKQFFKVRKLKKATLKHSKVQVLIWLIVWSLVEREVIMMERYIKEKEGDMRRFSIWTASEYVFQRYKAMISESMICTRKNMEAAPDVYERLWNHKSKRGNQYISSCVHVSPFVSP